MFKRKIVAFAMAGALATSVGLAGCGGNTSSASSASSTSSVASTTETSSSSTSSSSATNSIVNNEVVYWEGTLSDGSFVDYIDDSEDGTAVIAVTKSDLSDSTAWYGAAGTSADGKTITITDAESSKTISFTIVEATPTSITIDLEGYGEVEMAPVTKSDIKASVDEFVKEIEAEAENIADYYKNLDESTVFFWNGTYADGSNAIFVDDEDAGTASIAVIKADASDGETWTGKYTASEDGKSLTITDQESGKTVTYRVVESKPGTSMKLFIEGYGEVDLTPVTKADVTKLVESLS